MIRNKLFNKGHIGKALHLLLVVMPLISSKSLGTEWKRLHTPHCLPTALAVQLEHTPTDAVECLLVALFSADKIGMLVAQFDSDSRLCSVFRYIAVCRLIQGLHSGESAELVGEQVRCVAFANARAAQFLTLSSKLMQGVGPKLRAAWVMSDDEEASRSNLVCGQTQQWQTERVEWSSEEAKFDGIRSKMWLENVDFANPQHGLTWLVRLKRTATKEAALFESHSCHNTALGASFWDGWPSGWGLYFFRTAASYSDFITPPSTNSFDNSAFVQVGVTSSSPSRHDFFSNSRLVPLSSVTQMNARSESAIPDIGCGFRAGDSRMLRGTVRALAIMNDTMTELEIKHAFGLLR